jgi:hypothetical protein
MVDKLSIQIKLEGGAEVEAQLAAIGVAGQKAFANISSAVGQSSSSFAQATKSIAALGGSAAEALTNAAAAATKFGASLQQLQQVESIIRTLGARARDGSLAFGTLAANYDKARSGAENLAPAAAKVGTAVGSAAAVGAGLATVVSGLAVTLALVGAAVVAAGGALVKFATDAEETEKALTQLQAVSGQSFENLSALATVFAEGGTSIKKFAADFGNLSEKIAAAGQQMARGRAGADWLKLADDVDVVREKFTNLANGASVTFSPLTTLDTKVKALQESLSKVPAAEQYSRLADIFKNLGSNLERAQLGKALGLSPEEIATLKQGSAAIKEMQTEAQRLGFTLTEGNQSALQQMAQQWNQFTGLLQSFFQKIGAVAAPAFAQLLDTFKGVMQAIVSDFQNLPLDQAIANLGNRLAPAFNAMFEVLSPILTAIGTAIGNAIVNAIVASVREGIQNIKNKWGGGSGTMGPLQPGDTGFESRAGGGLLGGRGTGTSDSNLAWVSRGEHIMPAHAVAQPGVLALLEALRRSGGNLSAVLNGMGRFALGGMVPRAMPAFASGGLAGGMSNVTIAFPGLPPIGGLRASSAVVDELRKSAALAQVRSGGRKPSRYT